jgi:hypothetical protein
VRDDECNGEGIVVDTGRLENEKEFSSKTTSLEI